MAISMRLVAAGLRAGQIEEIAASVGADLRVCPIEAASPTGTVAKKKNVPFSRQTPNSIFS